MNVPGLGAAGGPGGWSDTYNADLNLLASAQYIDGLVGDASTPDNARLTDFLTNMPAGATARIPPGKICALSAGIVMPERKGLVADGFTVDADGTLRATAALLKMGDFDAVTLGRASRIDGVQIDALAGHSGDGLYVIGNGAQVGAIAVTNQGGDACRIGAKTGNVNSNNWAVRQLVALFNGGDALHIHDAKSSTLPDANAGLLLGLSARSNGGDAVHVGYALDNVLLGIVGESNVGYGLHFGAGAKGTWVLDPYLEANTAGQGIADAGSSLNHVLGLAPSGGIGIEGFIDNGTLNKIYGQLATSEYLATDLGYGLTQLVDLPTPQSVVNQTGAGIVNGSFITLDVSAHISKHAKAVRLMVATLDSTAKSDAAVRFRKNGVTTGGFLGEGTVVSVSPLYSTSAFTVAQITVPVDSAGKLQYKPLAFSGAGGQLYVSVIGFWV